MGKNTPACVAEADTANQTAQRRQTPAPQPVAYVSARQRPERKDYIMDRLVVPVEEQSMARLGPRIQRLLND